MRSGCGKSLGTGGAVWAVWLLAALGGCDAPQEGGAQPPVGAIDGQPLARADFVMALVAAQGDAFFDRYVDRTLVARAAAADRLTVTEAEVDAAQERQFQDTLKSRFQGNAEAFAAQMRRYGLTAETWKKARRADVRTRLLAEALVRHRGSEARVKELFDLRFGPGGVDRKVSHLLISTQVATSGFYTRKAYDAEREAIVVAARARAVEVRARLVAGADFGELARTASDDWSPRRGASLGAGWVGRFGRDFDEAVAALAVGGISPVVESRKGFHVARVDGVQKGARYTGAYLLVSARPSSPDDARDEAARMPRRAPRRRPCGRASSWAPPSTSSRAPSPTTRSPRRGAAIWAPSRPAAWAPMPTPSSSRWCSARCRSPSTSAAAGRS